MENNKLTLKWLGIETYKESIIYMNHTSHVCRSEGFEIPAQIQITYKQKTIIGKLNHVGDFLLSPNEVSLSKYAWDLLGVKEGDVISLSHPKPIKSLSFVRSKIYGHKLDSNKMQNIIEDISKGQYSDINIASFITSCAGHLTENEIFNLTKAMINVGKQLSWPQKMIVDKHCVGGLPGNRTSLIVVPIIAAFGLTIPKTSSRAITSPAGTADTMEVLAPVELDLQSMQKVVEKEGGCIIWGGSVSLSPADDFLVRVERGMNLDSAGQLIASVLSKKISAGSTHIIIDIPVGPTAKIRSLAIGYQVERIFKKISKAFNRH